MKVWTWNISINKIKILLGFTSDTEIDILFLQNQVGIMASGNIWNIPKKEEYIQVSPILCVCLIV